MRRATRYQLMLSFGLLSSLVVSLLILQAAPQASTTSASASPPLKASAPHPPPGAHAPVGPHAATLGLVDGQGVYTSCDPTSAACVDDLNILADAGVSLVINYGQFAPDTTLRAEVLYAQAASALGMRIIWSFKNFVYGANGGTELPRAYPVMTNSLLASDTCYSLPTTNYGFVNCLARNLGPLAATWGYYIGDELPASAEPSLRRMDDAIWDADRWHQRLYVANGGSGTLNTSALQAYGSTYSDGFETHPDATVIAEDVYPIGTSLTANAAAVTGEITAGLGEMAAQDGISYAIVLQAYSLDEYHDDYTWCSSLAVCPYPTVDQMVAMRDSAVEGHHPRLILWYSYFDVLNSDNYALRWSNLTAAINA